MSDTQRMGHGDPRITALAVTAGSYLKHQQPDLSEEKPLPV